MKESITSRVSRIISGSARKLVEILESAAPEIVMEEAIVEIDSAIFDVRSELGKISAAKYLANSRLMEANKKHEDLSAKIEFALEMRREDLAEAAVSQQLDIEAQIPVLETAISGSNDKIKELEGFVTALQAKKREMREELHEYKLAQESAKSVLSGNSSAANGEIEIKVARAEAAFDRVIENTTGFIGPDSIGVRSSAQLSELEELHRKNRIQERLASIKTKMKGS